MEEKFNSYIDELRHTSNALAKTSFALTNKNAEEKIESSKEIFKKSLEISAKNFHQEIEDESTKSESSKQKKYELLDKYSQEVEKVSAKYEQAIKKLLVEKENLEEQKRVALLERKKLKEEKGKFLQEAIVKRGENFFREEELKVVKEEIDTEIDNGHYEKIPLLAARARELEVEKEDLVKEDSVQIAVYNNGIKDKKTEYKQIKNQIKEVEKNIEALEIERENEIEKVGMSRETAIYFKDKSIIRKMQRVISKMLMTEKKGEKKFNTEVVQNISNNLEEVEVRLAEISRTIEEREKVLAEKIDKSFVKEEYVSAESLDCNLQKAAMFARQGKEEIAVQEEKHIEQNIKEKEEDLVR